MGRQLTIYKFLLLLIITISSCVSKNNFLTKDSIKSAYQIYFGEKYLVCLMAYDKWGEDNNILLYDKNLKLIGKGLFKIDPLPRIVSILGDTIVLNYNLNKVDTMDSLKVINYNPMKYLPDTYSKLGKFNIKYNYWYGLMGNSVGDTIQFDNFKIDKKAFIVSFYKEQIIVKRIPISELYFENGKIEFVDIENALEMYNILKPSERNLTDDFYTEILKIYTDKHS